MKMRSTLYTFTLAAMSAVTANASTWDASTSLERFDQSIADGLPSTSFTIQATDEAGATAEARMDIESMLDTVVTLPDGSPMATYIGSWNGAPATISRGDGQLIVDTDEPGHAVARFDTAIAADLPAHVHLRDTTIATTHSVGDNDDLLVRGAFGGDIVFADGSHGTMYDATWHGVPAVATRSGSHLDITSLSSTGLDVTGFTAGSDDIEHESLPVGGVSGLAPATRDAAAGATSRTRRSADVDPRPNRLTFHLMLHDDVGTSSQRIHAGYVAWWLADLQRNIVPGKQVDIFYSQRIPGVTDMRYEYVGSLHDWSDVIANYAQEQHIPRTFKHKFLLVVNGLPEPERYGRSWQKGNEGIASISGRFPEIAHQLGHLLGARHDNAEVRFSGWWCETNMYAPSLLLRSNCYKYSRANMRLIDDYIRTGEGFQPHSRWSEDR